MATNKQSSSRRTPEHREAHVKEWASHKAASLKWPSAIRKRWRQTDRAQHDEFEPLARDDEDFRWFFALGESPSFQGWSPEKRKRWKRIERCLDGGGFNLMKHYTNSVAEHVGLLADYRRYVQNAARSYAAANWGNFIVVTNRSLVAFIKALRPSHKIVTVKSLFRDDRLATRPRDLDQPGAPNPLSDVPFSTWGDRRVDASVARFLLEYSLRLGVADARQASDSRLLQLFRNELEKDPLFCLEQRGERFDDHENYVPPGLRTVRQQQLAKRDAVIAITSFAQGGGGGSLLRNFMEAESRWDPSKLEVDPERPTTTVSEIARWAGLDTDWVRRALVKEGCEQARVKRQPIPTTFLKSDRGRDFWLKAKAELKRRDVDSLHGGTRFSRKRTAR